MIDLITLLGTILVLYGVWVIIPPIDAELIVIPFFIAIFYLIFKPKKKRNGKTISFAVIAAIIFTYLSAVGSLLLGLKILGLKLESYTIKGIQTLSMDLTGIGDSSVLAFLFVIFALTLVAIFFIIKYRDKLE